MINPKPAGVLLKDCITVTTGNFADLLRRTKRTGVDGSGGKNSSHPRFRAVGAGCSVALLVEGAEGDWIREEAFLAYRVPGRQTVPRAEIWAALIILRVWDGTHDLEVVTDATYTVCGMIHLNRRKNRRGPNRDNCRLLYDELDRKTGAGILTLTKAKSHIDGIQDYCRSTPAWQILLNDLADYAADRVSDHVGLCGNDKK